MGLGAIGSGVGIGILGGKYLEASHVSRSFSLCFDSTLHFFGAG